VAAPSASTVRRRRVVALVVLAVCAAVAGAVLLLAGEDAEPVRYVDGDSVAGRCDDSRTADEAASPETPWCTLDRAAELASGGETVLVREGTYPETVIDGEQTDGTVTFKPAGEEQPVLEGISIAQSTGFRFEGFRIADQTVLERVARIALVGNDVTPHGVLVEGGQALLFEDNGFHDLTMELDPETGRCVPPRCGYGIRITNATALTIRDNLFSGVPGDGIQSGTASDYLIEGNEFERISAFVDPAEHSDSIQLYRGSTGVRIRDNLFRGTRGPLLGPATGAEESHEALFIANNTIVRQTDWGLKVHDAPGMVLANNTVWDTTSGVVIGDTPEVTAATADVRAYNNIIDQLTAEPAFFALEDHNLIGSGYRHGPHDLTGQPRFVDAAQFDYGLDASSPAIDAGTATEAPPQDRLGSARFDAPDVPNTGAGEPPYVDLGSLEFSG
jgi:Right handed beta helix region